MKQLTINNVKLEVNENPIKKFLSQIVYPIAIVDFETFRTFQKNKSTSQIKSDFFEKIFSVAFIIFTKHEELTINNLNHQKLRIFFKTELPKNKKLESFENLGPFQLDFYQFLVQKLLKYQVKSLIFLGSRTEIILLKNYLTYYLDKQKSKTKVGSFFINNQIFDLYDLWNNDEIINLPEYRDKKRKSNKIGATKKTMLLLKENQEYQKFLIPEWDMSNNDIGRIIDQYFNNKICLLDNFLGFVANHNKNDVLIGAAILSFLYHFS